jgi:hypothetical protein
LAKGPITIAGIILMAYGITGLIFGGHFFTANPISGTVNGPTWVGLEGNGWTNILWVVAGGLLLVAAPMHWGAKTMSLLVGLGLAAACVIALIDGNDVFGVFAANGWTKLAFGVAAVVLWILAMLPRVGKRDRTAEAERDADLSRHPAERRGNGARGRFGRDRTTTDEPVTTTDEPRRTTR